jgi:hypothetical protein
LSKERRLDIPGDVAREEAVPEDLDSTQRVPYAIPSTARRRVAGVIYLAAAAAGAVPVAMGFPRGVLAMAAVLGLIGVWHLASAWQIGVLDPEALDAANREVGFVVGHASAAVGFEGWRARPVWNVLVFSADDPPTQRALVRVDAVQGGVIDKYEDSI